VTLPHSGRNTFLTTYRTKMPVNLPSIILSRNADMSQQADFLIQCRNQNHFCHLVQLAVASPGHKSIIGMVTSLHCHRALLFDKRSHLRASQFSTIWSCLRRVSGQDHKNRDQYPPNGKHRCFAKDSMHCRSPAAPSIDYLRVWLLENIEIRLFVK
jgi:hypothetical protein